MYNITKAEKYWLVNITIIIVIITTLPYFIAFQVPKIDAKDPEGSVFSGFLFGIDDGNSYIAKMRLGYEGNWLYRSPYTDMPQNGFIAFFPYILLGKLASRPALHLQLVVLFQLFRIAAAALSIFAMYDFIAYFIDSIYWRKIGLIFSSVCGGLGWISLLNHSATLPLEFYSPESFGFLEIYGLPHLSLGRACLFWAILSYLGFWKTSQIKDKTILRLSFFWLTAGLAQPLLLGLIGLIIGLHWVTMRLISYWYKERSKLLQSNLVFWKLLIAGLLPIGFLFYNLIKFSNDPYLMVWNHQNQLPSGNLFQYILSYGFLIPFAIMGAYQIWKKNKFQGALLVPWLALAPILLSLPISIQRRTIEGAWVGLIILAIEGIATHINLSQQKYWRVLLMCGLLLGLVSSFMLLIGGIQLAIHPTQPAFYPLSKVRMMEALDDLQVNKYSVVLASFETSNALPAFASVKVIIGHGPESANGEKLRYDVASFYQSQTSDEKRRLFLLAHRIMYVIWGTEERQLGSWNPHDSPYLRLVYKDGEYFIYEVDEEKLSN